MSPARRYAQVFDHLKPVYLQVVELDPAAYGD
jgi:hypothetical protein